MNFPKKLAASILFSQLIFTSTTALADAGRKVSTIEYRGNSRISDETIFAYLDLNIGDIPSHDSVDKSIKSLFGTGFFADVKVSQSGNKLVVEVQENPMINKIGFDGNKRIEDKDLLAELTMKQHSVFSPYKLQSDINRISSVYQKRGRYSAQIEPKVVKLDQNRVDLVYEIEEGPDASIRKINYTGNTYFSDSDLADVILSKEYRFYRFFSNADIFDAEKQEYDKELLKRHYLRNGFADFKVTASTSELSIKKDAFLLTFVIDEGIIYNYGQITIDSEIKGLDTEVMNSFITIKENNTFNQDEIDEVVDNLTNFLGDKGYPFVDIDPVIKTHPDTGIADVSFKIKEGPKVYIRKINIKNNTRTLDKVIRREFKIAEGDPYNSSKIQRSKQRIENLGYFSKVDFKNVKTDEFDKADVDVEVEETSTGAVNFAVGYNTASGPLGKVVLSENNFLGKGQIIELGTTIAKKENNISFSFTEPYFMDKDLAVGFSVFKSTKDLKSSSSYKSDTVGFGLHAGYQITEHLTHAIRYNLKNEEIKDVSEFASKYIKDQKGKNTVSLIGHSFIYDKLDNRLEPKKGYLLRFDQDVAGLGGNTNYISNSGSAAYFKPLYKNDFILKIAGKAGNITGFGGKKVRLNDRFSMGQDLVRGFDIGGIGPRDTVTTDSLGGNNFYGGTAEIQIPLGLPNEVPIKGFVFHDFGSVFGLDVKDKKNVIDVKNVRASYGIGINYKSPLGLITVSYGIPYKKEKFDEIRRFYINFGQSF